MQEGTYRIGVSLDVEASDDLNPSNNEYRETVYVSFPDLKIKIASIPDEIVVNQECCIKVDISNVGGVSADNFNIVLLAEGQIVDTENIVGLGASSAETRSFFYTPTQSGQIEVRAVIDYDDFVLEVDEANNDSWTPIEVRQFSRNLIYMASMVVASTIILLILGILIKRK